MGESLLNKTTMFPVSVSNGGTGNSTLAPGDILIGNGTDAITTIPTLLISKGGTGGTTATSARTNLDVMHAATLYSNASGTNGTITLSDNVSNYSIIRFYYIGFVARQSCDVDVDTLANSEVCLQVNYCNSAQSATWSKSCLLGVSGNTVTFSRNTSVKIDSNGVSFDTTTTERMYILKVVGYKY